MAHLSTSRLYICEKAVLNFIVGLAFLEIGTSLFVSDAADGYRSFFGSKFFDFLSWYTSEQLDCMVQK